MTSLVRAVLQLPWWQFMPITLMNEHTGVFGVHVGQVWHAIPRLRGWLDALLDL